jgi:hypothetical protein
MGLSVLIVLVVFVVPWIVWWAFAALLMSWDQKRRTACAAARGEVNFDDGNIRSYLFWSLFIGALVLPLYFYATRKKAFALALGLAAMSACGVATAAVTTVILLLFGIVARLVS